MKLIADSGSTKVSWRAIPTDGPVIEIETEGINPVFAEDGQIVETLSSVKDRTGMADEIHFYGAGVIGDSEIRLRKCLEAVFPGAEIETASDIVAAARALCGRRKGIACILGTGSNTCLYDGSRIIGHVNAGGFILGDEGSGGDLGKALISDFVKGVMPPELSDELAGRYGLDYLTVVKKVYREAYPSRFLASFAPFISEHRDLPYIQQLCRGRFTAFLERNILQYPDARQLPISFTGSVAYYFRDELEKAVEACGLTMGRVVRGPIDALVEYHSN